MWQVQYPEPLAHYPEPLEGSAARGVAAGPRWLCVASAISRAARKVCGARCRRWAPAALCGRRSIRSRWKGLRRRWAPAGLSPQLYIGVCSGGVFVAVVTLAFAEEVSA